MLFGILGTGYVSYLVWYRNLFIFDSPFGYGVAVFILLDIAFGLIYLTDFREIPEKLDL